MSGASRLSAALLATGALGANGCGRAPSQAAGADASAPATTAAPAGTGPLGLAGRAVTSPDGVPYLLYEGLVPSFDGLPLAVDVTLPEGAPPSTGAPPPAPAGARPLVVLVHGWGADRRSWESETIDHSDPAHAEWNNVAFAARGYAVLTYTVRGWHDSCGPDRASSKYVPATLPRECADRAFWVHVADPRWEIRDAQHLIGRLVDAGVADPARIGVGGGSYGGAHAWTLALLYDRTELLDGSLVPWRSPAGVPLHVAAAAPFYTWASLTGALLPNGRATDRGMADGDDARRARSPVGVPLSSYLTGFFAGGPALANGFYATPGSDPSADFTAWFARFSAGPPFLDDARIDPLLARALDELERRSPLHLAPRGKTPVFQAQGLTDPLFPPVHALAMRNKVLASDPAYPIATFLGDIGHDNAQNPREQWKVAHAAANAFFDHYLLGREQPVPFDVTVMTTTCVPGQESRTFRAPSFGELARSERVLRSTESHTTTNLSVSLASIDADPLLHPGCRTAPASHAAASAWTFPMPAAATLLGAPRLALTARVVGADAPLVARLWDVTPGPGGDLVNGATLTLVSRGAYRWLAAARLGVSLGPQSFSFQLSANAWELQAGHALRLEIVANGAPEHLGSVLPASVTVSSVELTLPVAE